MVTPPGHSRKVFYRLFLLCQIVIVGSAFLVRCVGDGRFTYSPARTDLAPLLHLLRHAGARDGFWSRFPVTARKYFLKKAYINTIVREVRLDNPKAHCAGMTAECWFRQPT